MIEPETAKADVQISEQAWLFSAEPLIILVPWRAGLRFVEELGRRCVDRPITFLLKSVWDCNEACASKKAAAARQVGVSLPMHRLIFLGNTYEETDLLAAAGLDAFFLNHNTFVPDAIFRPVSGVAIEFDAVYNARPVTEKRHELAAEIDRVAYVSGVTQEGETSDARGIVAQLLARGPGHVVLNEMSNGLPRWIAASAVNEALARAAVGLCLSEVEGAMYSSVEYLVAGLPIVSTPSRGGRDFFFDPDYCLIAEPNPRDVRLAVEALRDRAIPRCYVRERTLAKLRPERDRCLAFLESIKARHGVPRRYDREWAYSGTSVRKWRSVDEHARDFFGRGRDAPQ